MAKTKQKKQQVRLRLLKRRARNGAHRSGRTRSSQPTRELPLVSCKVNSRWREGGAAVVVVARRKKNGLLVLAFFYVDVLGVGVRDCFRSVDCSLPDLEFWLKRSGREIGSFEPCSEELARQLVWGGFYYGKQNGFRPPKGFSRCKKFIPFLAEEEVNWELFGKDGKPLIVGDYRDLLRRSEDRLNLEDDRFHHYIVCLDPDEVAEPDPWEVLLEEDEGMPPGKEQVLFIEGTYFGTDFESLFNELVRWEDLDLLEEEEEYALFGWSRPYPKNHWNPFSKIPGAGQSLGEVKLEDEVLTVSVRGKSWMLIMNHRLAEAFGSDLTRGPLDIQDPLELMDDSNRQRTQS